MKNLKKTRTSFFLIALMAVFAGWIAPGSSRAQSGGNPQSVEVAVRVYDGDRFVDSLGPDDFELLENGAPRKIESFSRVTEKETAAASAAIGPNLYVLCFEMGEVPPNTGEAIEYFFENVPEESDTILVVTPLDQWKYTAGPKDAKARKRLADDLNPRLAESLRRGGQTLRQRLMTLRDMATFDGDEFMIRWRARDIIDQMIAEQSINETQYIAFADYFKAFPGQKNILIFYREEAFAVPPLFLPDWQKMAAARQNAFDRKRIRTHFADAGLTFHFLYLRKERRANVDIEWLGDGSALKGDFFQAFRDLAVTTGGCVATTSLPLFGMKLASNAAKNYYILTFRPEASPGDASFKEITVKIKNGGHRIFHRVGYIEP